MVQSVLSRIAFIYPGRLFSTCTLKLYCIKREFCVFDFRQVTPASFPAFSVQNSPWLLNDNRSRLFQICRTDFCHILVLQCELPCKNCMCGMDYHSGDTILNSMTSCPLPWHGRGRLWQRNEIRCLDHDEVSRNVSQLHVTLVHLLIFCIYLQVTVVRSRQQQWCRSLSAHTYALIASSKLIFICEERCLYCNTR